MTIHCQSPNFFFHELVQHTLGDLLWHEGHSGGEKAKENGDGLHGDNLFEFNE